MVQQDYQNFLITLGILILFILITKTISKYTHIKRITLRNLLHLCVGIACSFSVLFFETTLETQLSLDRVYNSFGKYTRYTQPLYLTGFIKSIFVFDS